jgi:hypothetical protein
MNAQLRQLLRGGMERFVQDVGRPEGLALRAYQHRRKRRLAARAATAAGVAAALAAVGVAGLTGAFGPGNGQQVQTAAYVALVRHALASQAGGGLVGYARNVSPAGTVVEPEPGSWKVLPGGGRSPRSWGGRGRDDRLELPERVGAYRSGRRRAAGRRRAEHRQRAVRHGHARGELPGPDLVARDRDPEAARPPPAQPSCFSPGVLPAHESWQSDIRQELSCGAFSEGGHQRVDGIDAVKLTGSDGVVLWIDPSTYLPVRQAGPGAAVTDFRWLRATPASLAKLKVIIPAGFRQVPPPRP